MVLWNLLAAFLFAYEAFTRYGGNFPVPLLLKYGSLGLFRFRSPLLTESRLISLPGAT